MGQCSNMASKKFRGDDEERLTALINSVLDSNSESSDLSDDENDSVEYISDNDNESSDSSSGKSDINEHAVPGPSKRAKTATRQKKVTGSGQRMKIIL